MSKSERTASSVELDEQKSDLVFDFLYHDARRVGSFLSQFDESGHLQQLKQIETADKTATTTAEGRVATHAFFAGAATKFDRSEGSHGGEGLERTYDPLWTNARTFLDYLTENSLLHKDFKTAHVGQFVLASGKVTVLDLGMIKQLWELPSIQQKINNGANPPISGSRSERRNQKPAAVRQSTDAEMIIEMLQVLPHGLQVTIRQSDGATIWGSLEVNSLVGASSDLTLKHGYEIAGEWNLVGILDANPGAPADHSGDQSNVVPDALATGTGSVVGALAKILQPITRTLLGRPTGAYGVTPLVIFRQVSAG